MSATGTVATNKARFHIDGDINTNTGMLGKTIFVSAANNFSIDPNLATLTGTNGELYHTYVITASVPNCTVFMPSSSIIKNGWRCRLLNKSANTIIIADSLANEIARVKVGFTAELILGATWSVTYFIPTLTSPALKSFVGYDTVGYPEIKTQSSLGMYSARLSGNLVMPSSPITTINWDADIVLDDDYYEDYDIGFYKGPRIKVDGVYSIEVVAGVRGDEAIGQNLDNITIGIINITNTSYIQLSGRQLLNETSVMQKAFFSTLTQRFNANAIISVVYYQQPYSTGLIELLGGAYSWIKIIRLGD
jgi:hypothetical protein